MLLHPEVYYRDCSRCLIYHYDEETGQETKDPQGRPIKRARGTVAPCRRLRGSECPKGTPEQPHQLTVRSRRAWEAYRKCKLTGRWEVCDWTLSLFAKLDELVRQCETTRETRRRAMEMEILTARLISRG